MRKFIVLLIVAAVFFGAGWGVDYWLTGSQAMQQNGSEMTKIENSGLVYSHSLILQGKVATISSKEITLTNGTSSLAIPLADNVTMSRVIAPSTNATSTVATTSAPIVAQTQKISLSDINAGDQVSLTANYDNKGTISVTYITVFPPNSILK